MSARREAIAGATILAVDDNPDNFDLVRQILEGQHEVVGALDGAEALAVARARQPDVILLDLLMPGMDGYKVLERLKADPATRAIPVLIFTARYRDIDHVVHGLELGALDYVTKPVDEEPG